MIKDEERREVARRLRGYVDMPDGWWQETLPQFYIEKCIFGDLTQHGEDELFARLADLIEPVERTCRMVSAFDTDELENIQENISFSPEDTLAYRCEGCGFDFRYERGLYPNYCPNCGAKVVSE